MKVRLEPGLPTIDEMEEFNFNSMKVRLEHVLDLDEAMPLTDFNSMKVRLERIRKTLCSFLSSISIP